MFYICIRTICHLSTSGRGAAGMLWTQICLWGLAQLQSWRVVPHFSLVLSRWHSLHNMSYSLMASRLSTTGHLHRCIHCLHCATWVTIHTHTCMHTYLQMHTHTHPHIHTHTHSLPCVKPLALLFQSVTVLLFALINYCCLKYFYLHNHTRQINKLEQKIMQVVQVRLKKKTLETYEGISPR